MKRGCLTNKAYLEFLNSIKAKIQQARFRAVRAANKELVDLYWQIGTEIVERQEKMGWGKAVVERLSRDLCRELPGTTGFSTRNLWDMRRFYLEYRHSNLRQVVAEIPWGQNLVILNGVKEVEAREYYLKATLEMGWSRNVLLNQIKAQAFERQALAVKQHNFQKALPKHLAEQADQTMKDIYMLDFLGIKKPVLEQEMERRMVNAIKDVLLELGYGFSFIGNQYKVRLGENEYFIDLLFYHRRLKCLVAIELKAGPFQPEYAGKMNFYLNLLDDFVREEGENPSIGIILCAGRNHVEAEYALRGIAKPIGVAKYALTRNLPKNLADKLPKPKELEKEILKEMAKEQTFKIKG